MPKLNKSFHLEITVEQFLSACSLIELQEVELRLDEHIRRAKHRQRVMERETDCEDPIYFERYIQPHAKRINQNLEEQL